MQALKFEKTGSLDELSLVNIDKPVVRPGEALVRVRARVDWSRGVGNRKREGFQFGWNFFSVCILHAFVSYFSDGWLFRYVAVPIAALSRKPASLDHSRAGSMTLPWLCAWITVDTLANVKEGDNVVIIGTHITRLTLLSFLTLIL
jgi:NADPH2:quinone reductase